MKKQTIITPEKKLFDTYKVEYCDKYFAKLVSVGSKFYIYEKCELLPANLCVGDIVSKFYDKQTKIYTYDISRKSQIMSAKKPKQLCLFYKNKYKQILFKNSGQKYVQTVPIFDKTCVVFENDAELAPAQHETQIILDFINKKNIKKIKSFHLSKWVISSIYNHTICLYNLFDFSDKKYISDTKLELNSQKGDIYYFVKIGKYCEYIFDKFSEEMLFSKYAKLFSEFDKIAKMQNQEKPSDIDKNIMKKYDKKNTKLFAKIFDYEFISRWCISEKQNYTENGAIYCLENHEGTSIVAKQSELPPFARPGDFVGVIYNGQYVFDRESLLNHLKMLEQISTKTEGCL